ncbi:MAG: cupin domain-containing protein [Deltaproteobacteria bacterium]|nr:cupin domain-containing protein [Deltaproteobacteria bacterium]
MKVTNRSLRTHPDEPGMDHLAIAKKIRRLRQSNKMTLEGMAEKTGFTKSYLSMIELGKKSPPIATMSKIAKALQVDIAAFFEQKKPEDHISIVRKAKRQTVVRDGTIFGYRYDLLAQTKRYKKMEPFIITLPNQSMEREYFDHEGEELFYVLEGRINFFYGDKKITLEEGDCVYFDSGIPHRGEGAGDQVAKALVVICGP